MPVKNRKEIHENIRWDSIARISRDFRQNRYITHVPALFLLFLSPFLLKTRNKLRGKRVLEANGSYINDLI